MNEKVCIAIHVESVRTGTPVLDLILEYCEKNGIDPETFAEEIITPKLTEVLAEELRAEGRLAGVKKVEGLLDKLM